MFKNDEPPVSLFSFQDIITTLTGIMIFFLLILVISMLEITESSSEEAPVYTEWREVEKQNNLARKHISAILKEISQYRQRLLKISSMNSGALLLEKSRLQEECALKQEKLEKLQQELHNQEQILANAKSRNARAEAEKKQLASVKQQHDKMKNDLENMQERIRELKKEIEKRKKSVNITVAGNINKKPLLIECSGKLITVVDLDSKEVKKFHCRTPMASDMIKEMISYLKNIPSSRYYFVFLIKPSAADYLQFITDSLKADLAGVQYGVEPILENEACY